MQACTYRYSALYNENLLKEAFKALGKSLLIVIGVSYGVARALDVIGAKGDVDEEIPEAAPPRNARQSQNPAPPVGFRRRGFGSTRRTETDENEPVTGNSGYPPEASRPPVDSVNERLIRIEKGLEGLIANVERMESRIQGKSDDQLVTRTELGSAIKAAIDEFSGRLEADIDRRFEVQNRSVQSLRTMVARTDELLEQVIEGIESASLST